MAFLPSLFLRENHQIFSKVNSKHRELQPPLPTILKRPDNQITFCHLIFELSLPALWYLLKARAHPTHDFETYGESLGRLDEGEGVVEE